jgi:hypothetical protein
MFMIPLVASGIGAIGSAVGSVGSAIGSAAGAIGGLAGTAAPVVSSATTTAGILGTGLSGWQALALGGSIFSGIASYSSAQQQAAAYQLQATNAVIQGNQQAMEYQKQGIAVLNRTIETNALIRARGSAGGIDPFSGSAEALSTYAMSKGGDEFNWAQSNSDMSILSGRANQASLLTAADNARSMGMFNLIGSGLMGVTRLKALG